MTIGKRIRDARVARNLTQEQLAAILGVDQSTISLWERDPSRRPHRDMMPKLASALRRTEHWIEGRPGASEHPRDFEPSAGSRPAETTSIDFPLLAEAIELAIRSLVTAYGVDIPRRRIEDVAEVATSTYRNLIRLRSDDAA